ncbi:hypothetical protein SEPCBS57363_005213 [Sporothrix epigloea]|uniref:non-specific serine/threonine protein kinase n=1 Tax=Sporothrix epigloea TaxID=1892477 RepID=A0ABP0DWN3_9PEZI
MCATGFETLKVLGKGSFGTVRLVREKALPYDDPATARKKKKQFYAMKVIRKSEMIRFGQEGHIRAERDFLVSSEGSNWAVPLIASFQDVANLYLVMEYMPGGDFLGLLNRENILDEAVARFYIAEMILAVEEAHALNYIHRDIKPDNFLISASGHLKISDFGLAFDGHWSHESRYYSSTRYSLLQNLGIYVAGDEQDQKKDKTVGVPGAMKHKSLFSFPSWPPVSRRGQQLLEALVTDKSRRLCSKRYQLKDAAITELTKIAASGRVSSKEKYCPAAAWGMARQYVFPFDAEDIKAHKFFKGLPWERLSQMPPPFIPKIRSDDDTRYFEDSDVFGDDDESTELSSPRWSERDTDKNNNVNKDGETIQKQLDGATACIDKGFAAMNEQDDKEDSIDEALDAFNVAVQTKALGWIATPYDSHRLKGIETEIRQLIDLGLPIADGEALLHFVERYGKRLKKRSRDRLLRDQQTKRISMELRKRNAFLGYTWRRMGPYKAMLKHDKGVDAGLAVVRSPKRGCF